MDHGQDWTRSQTQQQTRYSHFSITEHENVLQITNFDGKQTILVKKISPKRKNFEKTSRTVLLS